MSLILCHEDYLYRRGLLDRLGLLVLQVHLVLRVHLALQLVHAFVGRLVLQVRLVLRVHLVLRVRRVRRGHRASLMAVGLSVRLYVRAKLKIDVFYSILFYITILYTYFGLRGLQVLRVHLVLQDLQGLHGRLVDLLVGVGSGVTCDDRCQCQLGLQVLLKEGDLIKSFVISYLGLLVLRVRRVRRDHRAHLMAVRLSVHSRSRDNL